MTGTPSSVGRGKQRLEPDPVAAFAGDPEKGRPGPERPKARLNLKSIHLDLPVCQQPSLFILLL